MKNTSKEVCEEVIAHIRLKLRAPNMPVQKQWIEDCISSYKNSHEKNNAFEMKNFVLQKWLLADFLQLQLVSFPTNLRQAAQFCLTDNYVLQLVFVINVGQSSHMSYGQENNIQVLANNEIPSTSRLEPKETRMLMLELTDGTQYIQAIECEPIHILHLDLFPGTKMLIKGPVECRRGVIMLRHNNVELLGGQVSDWVQLYGSENLLACLGMPQNAQQNELPEQYIQPMIQQPPTETQSNFEPIVQLRLHRQKKTQQQIRQTQRQRTIITKEQKVLLENFFQQNNKPETKDYSEIAKEVKLARESVICWFQNRRKAEK